MRSIALAFSLLFVASLAAADEKEFRGFVTDEMCGAEHMMDGMTAKECADECVKMGSVYALFVPDDQKVYVADDSKKLEPYAGDNVVVKGTLSADGKSIKVTSIKKAEASR